MRAFALFLVVSMMTAGAAWADPPAGKGSKAKHHDKQAASPDEERADGEAGADPKERFPVCHATDEGTFKTLHLPAPAVRAHVGHGDVEGPCGDGDSIGQDRR